MKWTKVELSGSRRLLRRADSQIDAACVDAPSARLCRNQHNVMLPHDRIAVAACRKAAAKLSRCKRHSSTTRGLRLTRRGGGGLGSHAAPTSAHPCEFAADTSGAAVCVRRDDRAVRAPAPAADNDKPFKHCRSMHVIIALQNEWGVTHV